MQVQQQSSCPGPCRLFTFVDLDVVGGPMDSGSVKNFDVWQHERSKEIVDQLSQIIPAKGRLVWRGEYLCCGTRTENTIPELYITEALEKLGITDAIRDQRRLCMYVPGGLKALQLTRELHPILVHERSVDSGTHESSTS